MSKEFDEIVNKNIEMVQIEQMISYGKIRKTIN